MQWERPESIFARQALTTKGWEKDVRIGIGADGIISTVQAGSQAAAGEPSFDLLLPGMSNVHSHAFQRALAGLTEFASGSGRDNFWSWREAMYAFTRSFTPDILENVTTSLYVELLKRGYTAVGEFHYLHNDAKGKSYASPTELSDRVIAAARATGIHITHLPVMYETGNFGGAPATEGQKRFLHDSNSFLKLLEALKKRYASEPDVTLGVAPHSLRAVKPESLKEILGALPSLGMNDCPIHIHASEQEKEVADCLAWSNERPVEWLLNHHDLNAQWCVIHATHMTPQEAKRLACAGGTAGLCPTTEANLGDGVFPAQDYMESGGGFGIGSDSNVCISPWEELRMLEYAQRLTQKKRNIWCCEKTPSVGRSLYQWAAQGGAKALSLKSGQIVPGLRADLVALQTAGTALRERHRDAILDTLVFAITPSVSDVFVAGKRVVKNGAHFLEK